MICPAEPAAIVVDARATFAGRGEQRRHRGERGHEGEGLREGEGHGRRERDA
jgi:hypothetical protein